MDERRPQLPTAGQVLGLALGALRLRAAVAEHVPERTLRRALGNDDGVKPETHREVVDVAVELLLPDELLAAWGLAQMDEDGGGPEGFRRAFADEVAGSLQRWDHAAGMLRSGGSAVPDLRFAVLPWVRLFAVEMGVRVGAYLAVCGVERVAGGDREAVIAGRAFDHIVARYRAVAGGISGDELARGGGVSGSTVDEWLAGRALPQSESVLSLAAVLAHHVPGLTDAVAAFHLRVAVAASEGVRLLWQICPPPGGGHEFGPPRAAQFVIEFLVLLDFALDLSRHAPVEPEDLGAIQWSVALQGSASPGGQAILDFALRRARDSYLRADVLGVINGRGAERVLMLYRQIPTMGSLAREFGAAPTPFPIAPNQMLLDIFAWGKVSPNPDGWLMPAVPREEGRGAHKDGDDGWVVLRMPTDLVPSAVIGKQALEAEHARGDEREALAHNRRLVAMDPKNAMHHFWLGCSMVRVGRPDDGIAECRIACELDPTRSVFAVEVPIILSNAGRNSEALDALRRMEGRYDVDDHYANAYGYVLMLEGLHEEAITWFRRTLDLNPEHARAMRDLAHCLFATGNGVEARRWAKAARNRGERWTYERWKAGDYEGGRVPAIPQPPRAPS